jgi:hypothetical protein
LVLNEPAKEEERQDNKQKGQNFIAAFDVGDHFRVDRVNYKYQGSQEGNVGEIL